MLSWVAELPAGVLYGAEAIIGAAVLGFFIILIRGVQIKKSKDGDVEINTDSENEKDSK